MLWHKGDVNDAIIKVKESQKYLFVSVRDETTSALYLEMFENSTELQSILENSICLDLLKDTTEFQQFSEVYLVDKIPSIFIITYDGKMVDVIKDIPDKDILCEKLKQIYGLEIKDCDAEEHAASSGLSLESNVLVENNSTVEKMAEVRRLLAEKHKQKAEEEKQKEKDEELKRRELGRQLHQLKQTQKEREEEELKAEIRRKRNEDKEARDKILQQIEEDKLERKQRFSHLQPIKKVTGLGEEMEVVHRGAASDESAASTARLLFRFPDGSSINHKFNASDPFSVVRQFVVEHIQTNMNGFKLAEIKQFCPKQTISAELDSSCLLDLKLVPSASFAVILLKKPERLNQVSSLMNWVMSPLNIVYLTIMAIVHWFKLKWFGTPPQKPAEVEVHEQTESSAQPEKSSIWEERQKRLLAAQSRTIKKDKNFAGFTDSPMVNDDDEDEARWNGNSTQQM